MADVKPLILDSGTIKQIATGDTLGVANGGTGATTLTSNGVLIGNGTSAISATAEGTTGQVLTGVTGSAPTWATPSGGVGSSISDYKTSAQTITSSTTLVDCTGLSFAIGANEVYDVHVELKTVTGSGSMKLALTIPSGTAVGNVYCTISGANKIAQDLTSAFVTSAGMTTSHFLYFDGLITNSSTAGTVQLQFAQNVSNAAASTIYEYSCIRATRMS